jgi:putative transposase
MAGHHVVWAPGPEAELRVIRRIVVMLEAGTTAARVAAIRTSEGIPPPDAGRSRTDRGVKHAISGAWHQTMKSNIARNPLVVATVSYGRRLMGDQFRFTSDGPRPLVDEDYRPDNNQKVVANRESSRSDLASLAESDRDVRIAAALWGGRAMARKQRHTAEQVISKLREAEVEPAEGTAIAQVCKDLAITENTYYRRRRECGGMELDRAKRLKDLEKENARLERLPADAELDEAILREAASGRYRARRGGARRSSTSAVCSAPTASRGAGRARCRGRAARPSGAGPPCRTTSRGRWRGWSSRRSSTAATATGGSRRRCGPRASPSTISASSGPGGARA